VFPYTRVVRQTYTVYDEFFSKQFFIFQRLKSHVARTEPPHTQSYNIILDRGQYSVYIILSFRRIAQRLQQVGYIHLRMYIYNTYYYIHFLYLYRRTRDKLFRRRARRRGGQANFRPRLPHWLGIILLLLYYCPHRIREPAPVTTICDS